MVKSVVIHAKADDPHAEDVARHLQLLGISATILARERCFIDWNIQVSNGEAVIDADGKRLAANDILAVYWRHDFLDDPNLVKWEGISPPIAKFLSEQRARHVDAAFRRLANDISFVNQIQHNRECGSKALQHHIAQECELRVPDTFVGSDPVLARRFAEQLFQSGKRCCTKNIESTHAVIDGSKHARLTKLFTEKELSHLEGLAVCPMIFQEYIDKRWEYRVTVVGSDVFACRIHSQEAGGDTAVDWRNFNIPATPHFSATLDDTLIRKLVRLIQRLNLTYGAIDLIEDTRGEFVFLEVNSMGQWLWIEDLTELPISNAIARHLANPELIHPALRNR